MREAFIAMRQAVNWGQEKPKGKGWSGEPGHWHRSLPSVIATHDREQHQANVREMRARLAGHADVNRDTGDDLRAHLGRASSE